MSIFASWICWKKKGLRWDGQKGCMNEEFYLLFHVYMFQSLCTLVFMWQGWNSLETIIAAEGLALTLQSAGNLKEARELLERWIVKYILSKKVIVMIPNEIYFLSLQVSWWPENITSRRPYSGLPVLLMKIMYMLLKVDFYVIWTTYMSSKLMFKTKTCSGYYLSHYLSSLLRGKDNIHLEWGFLSFSIGRLGPTCFTLQGWQCLIPTN